MTMKTVDITDIFDKQDDEILGELLVRMASRLHPASDGRIPLPICLPISMQMLMGYIHSKYVLMCDRDGITISELMVPNEDGTVEITKEFKLKTRN